jgi:hypothetical protein
MPTTITAKHYNNNYYHNLAEKMLSELSVDMKDLIQHTSFVPNPSVFL